jgi:hypothetical protein
MPTDDVSAAAITDFLTYMREIAQPVNLDDKSPTLVQDANGGVRAANMKKGSAACTKLLEVSKCSTKPTDPKDEDDEDLAPLKIYPVCVTKTKQHFGIAPANKYNNAPKPQPDGLFVSLDGTCEYVSAQILSLLLP